MKDIHKLTSNRKSCSQLHLEEEWKEAALHWLEVSRTKTKRKRKHKQSQNKRHKQNTKLRYLYWLKVMRTKTQTQTKYKEVDQNLEKLLVSYMGWGSTDKLTAQLLPLASQVAIFCTEHHHHQQCQTTLLAHQYDNSLPGTWHLIWYLAPHLVPGTSSGTWQLKSDT